MPLIEVPSHRPEDLEHWRSYESQDAAWSRTEGFARRVLEARREVRSFVARGPCYVGVSWGKDSVVVAHLARGLAPLVWVRVEPIYQPQCPLVRDAYLGLHGGDYHELTEWCWHDEEGWHATGTLERGFARAPGGPRYVSGVRGEESGERGRRVARGLSTTRTCAPIGRWEARDVWAYLYAHRLPIHPVYAMSFGGRLDRDRLRVSSLGGRRGAGMGRSEWEAAYYPQGGMPLFPGLGSP